VSVAELPAQMLAEFTVTVGFGFTVTVEVFATLQMPVVPVTVYTVVTMGAGLMIAVDCPLLHE
jgi:hypothetical protein